MIIRTFIAFFAMEKSHMNISVTTPKPRHHTVFPFSPRSHLTTGFAGSVKSLAL